MRSAKERVQLVEGLSAVQRDASAALGLVQDSAKGALRATGFAGLALAGSLVTTRVLRLFTSRNKLGTVVGLGWRFAIFRRLASLLLVPLVKEFLVSRVRRAVLPHPSDSSPAYKVSEPVPSFFSYYSPRRILNRMLGL